MKGKAILLSIITLAVIFLDFKKRRDIKKSAIALAIFIFILSLGYSGFILIRGVPPLFLAHILLLIASYLALMWYLLRGKLYAYVAASPILTEGLYIVLNFIDGARYD